MRKALVAVLLAMVAGAALFQLMRTDSGYVLIAFGHTTVEMSLWTALFLALLAVAVLALLRRLLAGSRRLGRLAVRSRRAQSRTMAALVDFIEGNWRVARRALVKAAPRSASPLVNYLAAARCAYELKDLDGALALLHKAEQSTDTSELAVALTQARMQLDGGRYEQCLATLKRIKRRAPQHPVVLDLMADIYHRLGELDELEQLLGALEKHNVRAEQDLQALTLNVYQRQLRAARGDLKALNALWERMGKKQHKLPELMAAYATELKRAGDHGGAAAWLVKALKTRWQPEWAAEYAGLTELDASAQLATADRWLKEHPADPVLLDALGQLCLRAELWGKARDYFEASLKARPEPAVYHRLADLMGQLGEPERAGQLYREGLDCAVARREREESP